MYKVFFVDDEAATRAGIRDNIDWDNSAFTLAGEAPDGEMALSLMRDIMPDILITDVKMPFMDGLTLAKQTRKTMPWVKIIILSGHDEFEYAKQAITIGVEDYLLKPVTSTKLLECLSAIAVRIETEKEASRNVQQLIEETKKTEIEQLLSDLLYGGVDAADAAATAEALNLSLAADHYLVMRIELHSTASEGHNHFYEACERTLGILSGWEGAIFFSRGPDRVVCILRGADAGLLEEDAYACAQAVKQEVERGGLCTVKIAIGSVVSTLSEWPKSRQDADAAKQYFSGAHQGEIIGKAPDSKYSDIISKAQAYIQENYHAQSLSLHAAAKAVNISPNHFSTIFSQETGETFINYVTRVRLEQAKALLKTSQMKTSEVGYAVGYNDTHYFSYVFKKNAGMTPTEFRNTEVTVKK